MPRITPRHVIAAIVLVAGGVLAGCDEPAPRRVRSAPPPGVIAAPEPFRGLTWNDSAGRFELAGRPLPTAKTWTFDGSTQGFTAAGSELTPGEDGARLANRLPDPMLRSPAGLGIDGSRHGLVLVRLTRVKAGGGWDGSLYYATPEHGESQAFVAKPVQGADPAVGETAIVVYDLTRLASGGDDWRSSRIEQFRVDTDDQAGGEFILRQVAVAESPDSTIDRGAAAP